MIDTSRHYANRITTGWIVILLPILAGVFFFGPDSPKIALLSVNNGNIITYGAIYLLGSAIIAFVTFGLLQWKTAGADSFLELGNDWASTRSTRYRIARRTYWIAGYLAIALATCYILYVRYSKSFIATMEHDAFVYLDGAYRIASGQRQHIDFHTPMGFFCNWLPYWGMKVAGGFPGAMEWAGLLAGIAMGCIGLAIVAPRLSVAVATPLLLYLCILAVIPLGVESQPDKITTAMFYNRLGWSAITLVFLFFLEPESPSRLRLGCDALCLSLLLLFLLYLKITYFAVSAPFLLLLLVSSRYNRRLALLALPLLALWIGVVELKFGLNGPYLRDILMAIHASGANRGTMLIKASLNVGEFAIAAAAVVLAWSSNHSRWSYCLYLAFVGYVTLGGLAIIDQNTHVNGVICLLAITAVCQELIRRSQQSDLGPTSILARRKFKCLACLFLLCLPMLQATANCGVAAAMIHSAVTTVKPKMPGSLNGIVFVEQLWREFCAAKIREPHTNKMIPARSSFAGERQTTYIDTVLAGVDVLVRSGSSGKRILTFDFVSPFSFVLAAPPPPGGHTCLVFARTLSEKSHPPADELLGPVECVMVPRLPVEPATTEFLSRTYGEYLHTNFEKQVESPYWVLWTRKNPLDSADTRSKRDAVQENGADG